MNKKEKIESLEISVERNENKIDELIDNLREIFKEIGLDLCVRKVGESSMYRFRDMTFDYDKQPVCRKRLKALEEYIGVEYVSESSHSFYKKIN